MQWTVLGTAALHLLGLTPSVSAQVSGRAYPVMFPALSTNRAITVAPKKFLNLPLGQVKPAGWLHDQVYRILLRIGLPFLMSYDYLQLMVQTNGLAGHEHDFYD